MPENIVFCMPGSDWHTPYNGIPRLDLGRDLVQIDVFQSALSSASMTQMRKNKISGSFLIKQLPYITSYHDVKRRMTHYANLCHDQSTSSNETAAHVDDGTYLGNEKE
jgi:hypothetical protein